MASRIQRPRKRRMLSLTVQGSEQPSPHFMTVTLGGEDVQHLQRAGFDQAGRLFFAEGHSYTPAPGAVWQLLVGDESALPAILAILEQSAANLPAEVFLEVPSSEDIRSDITAPPGSVIRWLPRTDAGAKPGALALDAVKQARLPDGPFYAWTAGESSMATGIRRHLVSERYVPKFDISFRGYFSYGRASL